MKENRIIPRWLKWAGTVAVVLAVIALGVVPNSSRVFSQVPMATSSAVTIRIEPANVVVPQGKKFTVRVVAEASPAMDTNGLAAYEVTWDFDDTKLQLDSVQDKLAESTTRTVGQLGPTTEKDAFGAYSYDENDPDAVGATGTVVLARATFTALQTGTSTLDLTLKDTNNNPVTMLVDALANAWFSGDATRDLQASQSTVTVEGTAATQAAFWVDKHGNVGGNAFNWGSAADIAEFIATSQSVEPGDLVEIDPERPGRYRKTSTAYSTLVSGVISTKPAITMGQPVREDGGAVLALMGRVPVKASAENGPIQVGDLLVSSSTPGHVMRCTDLEKCAGALIGKALESLGTRTGTIEMLVVR